MKHAIAGVVLATATFGQQIPRPAAPWSAKTLDNKILTLQQFKGKPIVLAFLLTT